MIYDKLHENVIFLRSTKKTTNNGILSQRFRRGQCVRSCHTQKKLLYSQYFDRKRTFSNVEVCTLVC